MAIAFEIIGLNFLKRIFQQNILYVLPVIILVSCHQNRVEIDDDVLLRISDRSLTKNEVIDLIPQGLQKEDSVKLFNAIVNDWINSELLSDFAEERIGNIEEIEKKVKKYRNQLIVQEYLTKMSESRNNKIDDREIKDYYEQHISELKTDMPLVKGVFIKVISSLEGKEEISALLKEDKEGNIDKLEQNWLDALVAYEYFKDEWVDWETLTELIPYRFGNPDQFLSNNKYFETEIGDYTYILQICSYLPTGSEQPYEFASHWITRLLKQEDLNQYEKQLVESLIKESIKDNKLEVVNYDPLTHKWKDSINQ